MNPEFFIDPVGKVIPGLDHRCTAEGLGSVHTQYTCTVLVKYLQLPYLQNF